MARTVRRRIFDGTYAAGAFVRLDQLAAGLGVSVTPVREALFDVADHQVCTGNGLSHHCGMAGEVQ